jgi:hypothetical protein
MIVFSDNKKLLYFNLAKWRCLKFNANLSAHVWQLEKSPGFFPFDKRAHFKRRLLGTRRNNEGQMKFNTLLASCAHNCKLRKQKFPHAVNGGKAKQGVFRLTLRYISLYWTSFRPNFNFRQTKVVYILSRTFSTSNKCNRKWHSKFHDLGQPVRKTKFQWDIFVIKARKYNYDQPL